MLHTVAVPECHWPAARSRSCGEQLSVPVLKGAVAYRTQIAPNNQFGTVLFDGVSFRPPVHWPNLPDGDYVAWVRSIDAKSLERRDADHYFIRYNPTRTVIPDTLPTRTPRSKKG